MIGCDWNPRKKIKELRSIEPKIKLVASGPHITASYLRNLFRKRRIDGEWYKLSNEEVKEAVELINGL